MKDKRLKIGVYSFTSCEGCTIVFIEMLNEKFSEYLEKIDFVDFRALRTFTKIHKTDVAIVEGAISTKDEVKKIKKIRRMTRKLIALGSCAGNGYPSNGRNSFSKRQKKEIAPLLKKYNQIEKVSPLKDFVRVDSEIEGCPVTESDIINAIAEELK